MCVGGEGIPMVENLNGFSVVEAIIDKYLASAVLAYILECEELPIVTDVSNE